MFWVNDPATTTPISADNLSRLEKYLLATAGSNGDFYVTIPNASGLAANDIVNIAFPAATNGASNARLSLDGGSTYKEIRLPIPTGAMSYNMLASAVQNGKVTLVYDGTYFMPTKSTLPIFIPVTLTLQAPATALSANSYCKYYPLTRKVELNAFITTTALTANTLYSLATIPAAYYPLEAVTFAGMTAQAVEAIIAFYSISSNTIRFGSAGTNRTTVYINGGWSL